MACFVLRRSKACAVRITSFMPETSASLEILDQLKQIAPVTAIRGNIDKAPWARKLPETEVVELAGVSIYVLHDLAHLDLKPEARWFSSRDFWAQPRCQTGDSKRCALFQSRQRGTEAIQAAGERGETRR